MDCSVDKCRRRADYQSAVTIFKDDMSSRIINKRQWACKRHAVERAMTEKELADLKAIIGPDYEVHESLYWIKADSAFIGMCKAPPKTKSS